MRKEIIKQIIRDAVSNNKLCYWQLSDHEKHELAYHLLFQDEQGLVDADHEFRLQQAVAFAIKRKGDYGSLRVLYSEIQTLFIHGHMDYDAHYADKIDKLLNEEWSDQNARPNEHFEHDAMNRAADAQSSMHPSGY